MTSLHAIPIRNEVRGKRGSNLDIAIRLLNDIGRSLETLVRDGRASLIDLRHVPHMTPETYQHLREVLGTGEVTASVAGGTAEITETATAGVWWVTHRDADGETVTEIIEITEVPAILKSSKVEIEAGIARLAAQIGSENEQHRMTAGKEVEA